MSHYGVDTIAWTDEQVLGGIANMDRSKARRQIESGACPDEDFEYIYQLYMLAYDDLSRAARARDDARRESMKRKTEAAMAGRTNGH